MVAEHKEKRGFVIGVSSRKIVNRIDEVLTCLAVYDGEPVLKGVHPLHRAVVELEKVSRSTGYDKQKYKLVQPLDALWFSLLWASRDGMRCKSPRNWNAESAFILNGKTTKPMPKWALGWAKLLTKHLRVFRQLVVSGNYEKTLARLFWPDHGTIAHQVRMELKKLILEED